MVKLKDLTQTNDPVRFRKRINIVILFIFITFMVLLVRLWFLQIMKGDDFRQRSENNSVRLRKIQPMRGLIFDAQGIVLTDNQPAFDIVFTPNRNNSAETLQRLKAIYQARSQNLSVDGSLLERIRPFTSIRLDRNIGAEKIALVETHALDLPGIGIEVMPVRKHLEGELMAHVIGYTAEVSKDELVDNPDADYSPGDQIGKAGIEKQYDPYIRGSYGAEQVEINVIGKVVRVMGKIDPIPGGNVTLTVDSVLQKTAWEALAGRTGAVVALDPRNGKILALVSAPSYDPNVFNGGISLADWGHLVDNPLHPMTNRAITGQYPPGSTYKLMVAAAALEEEVITPEATFYCNGTFVLGNRTYRCWQKQGHGHISLHRAIVESCDVFFYNLGKLIGADKMADYARSFGLGAPTGIDLPLEKEGLTPTKQWKASRLKEAWQLGETISLAIGQGYNLVTMLQLAVAYGALGNGGILYRPRIVERIVSAQNSMMYQFNADKLETLFLKPHNVEFLKQSLWGVINEKGGTGYVLKRKELDVAGKTGTAQVVGLPEDETARRKKILPASWRDHALFVCFAPMQQPEIVIAVIVENAGHGGTAAAPIARKVMDKYFERKMGAAVGG